MGEDLGSGWGIRRPLEVNGSALGGWEESGRGLDSLWGGEDEAIGRVDIGTFHCEGGGIDVVE